MPHETLYRALAAGVEAEIQLIAVNKLGKKIANGIIEDAQIWPADLIVAGTHGRTGLGHLLMGSVAKGIVRGGDGLQAVPASQSLRR